MNKLAFGLPTAFLGLVVSLLIAEAVSRYIMPLAPGARLLGAGGQEESLFSEPSRIAPSLNLTQVAPEFAVKMSTTALGYRGPDAGASPEVVFIGDSFTFGTGLTDTETISSLYCEGKQIQCANLGVPGSGTAVQINTLEHFLVQHEWRPKTVIIMPLMMTQALFAGNDLEDNLQYAATSAVAGADRSSESTAASIQRWAIKRSNLVRLIKFRMGGALRNIVTPKFDVERLQDALKETTRQFDRLRKLACLYSFQVRVVLLHPMQSIARNYSSETLRQLQMVVPWSRIEDTAGLFLPDPSRFYYSFDGHFNSKGSLLVANYLRQFDAPFVGLDCRPGKEG